MTADEINLSTSAVTARALKFVGSGRWARRVVKQAWPKGVGYEVSTLVNCESGKNCGTTIRGYHLQQIALDSPDLCCAYAEEAFLDNLAYLWECRFESELWRLIDNHDVVLARNYTETPLDIQVRHLPRRSLFGRLVYPYKASSGGDRYVVDEKYSKCPAQVIEFHPDIVHFQFPNLESWVGSIQYRERESRGSDENEERVDRIYRAVMASGSKPVCTDLGRAITILPPGFRGWLYKVVWTLLRVKP